MRIVLTLLILSTTQLQAISSPISVVPKPVILTEKPGIFTLLPETLIKAGIGAGSTAEQLGAYLRPATGYAFEVTTSSNRAASSSIELSLDKGLESRLGREGYQLTARPAQITIRAAGSAGLFYGSQTLLQLLPSAIFSPIQQKNVSWTVPCVDIEDYPRFSYRGFLLDEARYFKGEEVVKRHLDRMALHKMNVFHWHLTDDQGWRIEIKEYPKLTEIGSKRTDTQIGGWDSPKRSGQPHFGFYTQEQIRGIVHYAAERHITIVPEIEMPGHASAAIAAYPELGTLQRKIEVAVTFGKKEDTFNPADEEVYKVLQTILSEIMNLFPGQIIHIGGDEVKFGHWEQSPEVRALMEQQNLTTLADVQIYFTNRISRFIESNNRRMMGWNDILGHDLHGFLENQEATSATLAQNTVVHFWKGSPELAEEAIRRGHDVVMSYHIYNYLDYDYETTPLRKAYEYEPVSDSLTFVEAKKIIGVACCMWGEWIPTLDRMEFQTWPRTCAYAETGWTPKNLKDWGEFRTRLQSHLERLDNLDIQYAPLEVSDR